MPHESATMCRSVFLLFFLFHLSCAQKDFRDALCNVTVTKLGVTFYTKAELCVILKCIDPTIYADPKNTSSIASKVKSCVLGNSGNKAMQALSLYTNANNCLSPEALDDVCLRLIGPLKVQASPLIKAIQTSVINCKANSTQSEAAKPEFCAQKGYEIALAALTKNYVDGICKKIVNQNVTKQEWGCGLKYIPQLLTFSKYNCSKIVKN